MKDVFFSVFAMSLSPSVYMCFVVTCLERADPSALVCGHSLVVNLSLSHWYPGQVWYLIVLIPDLCTLTYFGETAAFIARTLPQLPVMLRYTDNLANEY